MKKIFFFLFLLLESFAACTVGTKGCTACNFWAFQTRKACTEGASPETTSTWLAVLGTCDVATYKKINTFTNSCKIT